MPRPKKIEIENNENNQNNENMIIMSLLNDYENKYKKNMTKYIISI